MSRRTQENIIAFLLLFVFLGAIYLCLGYSVRSRMVPLPIAILCAFLISVQIIWQNFRSTSDLQIDVLDLVSGNKAHTSELAAEAGRVTREAEQSTSEPKGWKEKFARSEFGAISVLVALIALFMIAGPIPAVFVFSLGYFILSGHCSTGRGWLYATLCTVTLFVMFDIILKVEMNRGLLAPVIDQFFSF